MTVKTHIIISVEAVHILYMNGLIDIFSSKIKCAKNLRNNHQ